MLAFDSMKEEEVRWVSIGRLHGPFGLKGWIRVQTYIKVCERVLDYPEWWLARGDSPTQKVIPLTGRDHSRGLVVQLQGVDTPEAAKLLSGMEIHIPRDLLPPLEGGGHYWDDLIGLQVITDKGESLGEVESLFATGANDVVTVRQKDGSERLLPYTEDVVRSVDTVSGTLTVSLLPGM